MTVTELIDLWESFAAMGRDLGCSADQVRKWYNRDKIPRASSLFGILIAAKKRAKTEREFKKVTADALLKMVAE